MKEPKLPNSVELWEGRTEYIQDSDDCDDNQLGQNLNVSFINGGAGKYFVIETQRWAFDNIEELITVLRDAERRIMK